MKSFPYCYKLYGQRLASQYELGSLPEWSAGSADFKLQISKQSKTKQSWDWFHTIYSPSGKRASSYGRRGRQFIVRYHGIADYQFSKSSKIISARLLRGGTLDGLHAIFLTQAFPLLLSHCGFRVLHASATLVAGGAIAFLAPENSGKSTLASAFVHSGYDLITDDALIVDIKRGKAIAAPSFPEVRVSPQLLRQFWGSSKTTSDTRAQNKKRANVGKKFCTKLLPLRAIYCIVPGCPTGNNAIAINPLPSKDAWANLIENSFRLDLQNTRYLSAEVDFLSELVSNVPVYTLKIRRRFGLLPSVVEEIVQHQP